MADAAPQPGAAPVLRHFSREVSDRAPQWRTTIEGPTDWEYVGPDPTALGESRGFFVRSPTFGDGFAKPGRNQPPVREHPRAAHEKIASDLAYDLGLPVPPVVLWRRPVSKEGQEEFVAVSAVPFEPAFTWRDATLSEELEARLTKALETPAAWMCAFDTWIGNYDRMNDGNLLVQEDVTQTPALARCAYIDFAGALSRMWTREVDWKGLDSAIGFFPPKAPRNPLELARAVERIEQLESHRVEEIVRRLPVDFLPDEPRERIWRGLSYRQETLRTILRNAFREFRS